MTADIRNNTVHQDEFCDLKAEVGKIFESVNQLDVFKATQEQNSDYNRLLATKNQHRIHECEVAHMANQLELQKFLSLLDKRVTHDKLEEELEILQHAIEANAGSGMNQNNSQAKL